MLLNYIKTAWRNLKRQKGLAFINIVSLTIGLTGSLLMFVYVFHELSYENFHENRDRVYRVAVEFGSGQSSMKLAGAMPALGPAARASLPEVNNAVRLHRDTKAVIQIEQKSFQEQNFYFADSTVFKVFSFHLVQGSVAGALTQPFQAVISQQTARRYFGEKHPLGQMILYNGQWPLQVIGVMEDVPANTHLRCDLLVSMTSLEKIKPVKAPWNQFGDFYTYLLLAEKSSPLKVREKLQDLLKSNTNPAFAGMLNFHLQALADIYLHSRLLGELSAPGNVSYVYLFSVIATLVLLIACLNYMNLATARSLYRAREIGMRKTLGAGQWQLRGQFLAEAFVVTSLAMLLSLLLFEIIAPSLNQFLGTNLTAGFKHGLAFYLIFMSMLIVVSLAAGFYPAFYLSRFNVLSSIRGQANQPGSGRLLRQILVIFQFAIAVFLMMGTLVVYNQLQYMKKTDLGFDKNNVVLISFPAKDEHMLERYYSLKTELLRHPDVLSLSGAYTVPGLHNVEQQSVSLPGRDDREQPMMRAIGVDYEYIQTLGLSLLEGRNFSVDHAGDDAGAVIINETAQKRLELEKPVGAHLILPAGPEQRREVQIIGVIKDFHVESLHSRIEPLFLYINPERFYTLAIRLRPGTATQTLDFIKSTWQKMLPDREFSYSYLRQTYDRLYITEQKISQFAGLFSLLALLISCAGLFGLASFSVEQRTREIGIRRVLGAGTGSLIGTLVLEFTRWVVLAIGLAWPLAWFTLNKWLENFAYRDSIPWWTFFLSGLLALIIALITVSGQALRAALINPVQTLRYE